MLNSWIAATTSPGSGGSTGYTRSRRYDQRSRGSDAARRLSRTVESSNSSRDWNDREIPTRTRLAGERSLSSTPSRRTTPVRIAVKPVMASMADVLPAPLGPIRPVILPGCTVSVSWSTAVTPP